MKKLVLVAACALVLSACGGKAGDVACTKVFDEMTAMAAKTGSADVIKGVKDELNQATKALAANPDEQQKADSCKAMGDRVKKAIEALPK